MNLKEPYVQKGLAAIVLAIALAWLIFFTGFLPFSRLRTQAQVEQLRQELQAAAGELNRIEAAAKSLPTLQAEIKNLEDKWDLLRTLLPKATEMSSLLASVTTAGMRAGVEFVLFEPGEPVQEGLYVRYPIRLAVSGTYHQVGRFFNNLCNMERLVGISALTVTASKAKEGMATVEASATISAYTYAEGPPSEEDGKRKRKAATDQR